MRSVAVAVCSCNVWVEKVVSYAMARSCVGCLALGSILGLNAEPSPSHWPAVCVQDSLTEELAGMAASLKSSTLAVEGKLRERGQLLGVAETALDHSLHHTRKSAAEATRIHSK